MKLFFGISLTWGLLFLSSCTNNSVEVIAPSPSGCDTTDMTYSVNIAPIFTKHGCLDCHSAQVATSGIVLDNYNDVSANADVIMPSLAWPSGYPSSKKMPPGGPQVTACEIHQFIAWMNQGKTQ
ncbi:MAG: hypothetical protein GC180_10835 [Bacteroidetes bacterium]|nr:hypothetical protein [Bacteroidota bacterium]